MIRRFHDMPTASRLYIAAHCIWPWQHAAEVAAADDDAADSFAARRGTLMHRMIEETLLGVDHTLSVDHDDQGAVEAHALNAVWSKWWAEAGLDHEIIGVERQVATSGTRIGGESRDYTWAKGHVAGTADLVTVAHDEKLLPALHVWDWKSGSPFFGESVDEHRQLIALAAMLMHTNATTVRYAHAVIHLVYISEEGVTHRLAHVSRSVMDETNIALRNLEAAIRGELRDPNPGDHCHFCPARSVCPETRAIASTYDEDTLPPSFATPQELATPTNHRFLPTIQSAEHARWLLARLKLAEGAVAAVETALKEYADAVGGVELEDGKVWRRTETTRETVTADQRVGDILREYGLVEALKVSTSKTDVERAAKSQGDPMRAKEALAALDAAGLVKRSPTVSYKAVKP